MTQKGMEILYFGNEYSHTYAAAEQMFGGAEGVRYIGGDSVDALLVRLKEGACDHAVVPLENSAEGTVTETLDSVCRLGLYYTQELVMPICQNLVGMPGAKPDEIRRVYSHPQAISQCRAYLAEQLPQAKAEAVAYTSAGLEKVRTRADACIARKAYGALAVLAEHIEDSAHNATRFACVSRTPAKEGEKVSVAFSTPNRPGELLSALTVMRDYSLNMTKIESRPDRNRLGGYVFYTDFILSGQTQLGDVLAALGDKTINLRYLGRYRQAQDGTA